MKNKVAIPSILFLICLTACQAATPAPITASTGADFSLAAGQTVTLTDADLSITFISVSSDERCPTEIECAVSGAVTVHLSIRDQDGTVSEEVLQTFTDSSGLAPTMDFEGIRSHVTVDDYEIKVTRVLPYPQNPSSSIQPSEYTITLQVTRN
jgi:hypothetical protein